MVSETIEEKESVMVVGTKEQAMDMLGRATLDVCKAYGYYTELDGKEKTWMPKEQFEKRFREIGLELLQTPPWNLIFAEGTQFKPA